MILIKVGISILSHDETVLPSMSWRLIRQVVFWARLIHHRLNIKVIPSKGLLTITFMALVFISSVGVNYKI